MNTPDSWVELSFSRSIAIDNEALGLGRGDDASMQSYTKVIEAELATFLDVKKLQFTGFEKYNNDEFYTVSARLAFNAEYDTPAKTHVEGLGFQLARALHQQAYFDIVGLVINGITFPREAILNSKREAHLCDLVELSAALYPVAPLTSKWFEFQINDKDLQADTLIPALDGQINHMEMALSTAKAAPFKGPGISKTHEQQTRVIFMNTGARSQVLSDIIRANVVNGDFTPDDIISELKAARRALVTLVNEKDFHGKPAKLIPGEEVQRLAREFGPTLDRGSAQMRPDYLERTLSDFPMDTVHGKMMRYGMFLAAQLAMEILEGAGGTPNIRDLHVRLAGELGATVVPPSSSNEDDYKTSPGL